MLYLLRHYKLDVTLVVMFFDDISNDEAIQVIEKYGIVAAEPSPWSGNVWTVTMNESDITALAGEDAVQWIESVPPPPTPLTVHNDESRTMAGKLYQFIINIQQKGVKA